MAHPVNELCILPTQQVHGRSPTLLAHRHTLLSASGTGIPGSQRCAETRTPGGSKRFAASCSPAPPKHRKSWGPKPSRLRQRKVFGVAGRTERFRCHGRSEGSGQGGLRLWRAPNTCLLQLASQSKLSGTQDETLLLQEKLLEALAEDSVLTWPRHGEARLRVLCANHSANPRPNRSRLGLGGQEGEGSVGDQGSWRTTLQWSLLLPQRWCLTVRTGRLFKDPRVAEFHGSREARIRRPPSIFD